MKLLCIRRLRRTVEHTVDRWIVLRVERSSSVTAPVVDQLSVVRDVLFLQVQGSKEFSGYWSEMHPP